MATCCRAQGMLSSEVPIMVFHTAKMVTRLDCFPAVERPGRWIW